jgi:hypothetical protein
MAPIPKKTMKIAIGITPKLGSPGDVVDEYQQQHIL